jgi:hypothetical protein
VQHKTLFFLVWLICFGLANQAWANGRFPRAVRLIQNPQDPTRLVLAGTFGLAVTQDGGQSWNYVCEAAFSDPDTILDPLVGFANDGTLYTGTALDLRRSDADVCEFDIALGKPGQFVPDYTFDVDGQSLVAVVSSVVDGTDQATVQVSPDGTNWEPLGPPIEERSVLTLDVAPSDAQRLYISALAPEFDEQAAQVGLRGVLLVSSDRGQSWRELDIPGASFDAQPFIARIHPTDPDVVYVRLNGQKLDDFGLPVADDALLVSNDAGETWQELIRQPSKLLAFALSPDAETVLVGFGVSDDSAVGVTRGQHGLYRITREASDPVQIERLLDGISTHCLTWTDAGLYVCLRQFANPAGFEVGFTSNHEFSELDELTPLLLLNELEAPRTCPGEAEAAVCGSRWETDCKALLSCPTTPSTNGGAAGAASDGATESGGAQTSGTGGGAAGTGGQPPLATGSGNPATPKDSANCMCRLGSADRGSDTQSPASLAWLLVGGAGYARRRQRPSRQHEDRS